MVKDGKLYLPRALLLEARKRAYAKHIVHKYSKHTKGQDKRVVDEAKIRNLASKSALSYIACYAKNGTDYVYLQRGYRNYGIPQVNVAL